jgi:hypothetical protein
VASNIKVFIEYHRGPVPSNPDQLYSESAIDALVSCYNFTIFCTIVLSLTYILLFFLNEYDQEMVRLHAEGIDWRKEGMGPMALYTSGGGKSHGR